ncbi:MAG: glycerophosphodiester phosphodiesterase [Bacillota bacterium]
MTIIFLIIYLILILNILQFLKAKFSPKDISDKDISEYGFFNLVDKPINIGHRGASGHFPENTILAFDQALKLGAKGLEFDLKMTSDNKVLVFHDDDTLRMTGDKYEINETEYNLLKKLIILETEDEKIPLLREVLNNFPDVPMVIEIKDIGQDVVNKVAEVIKETESGNQILLGSFNESTIKGIREALPDVPTAACEKEAFLFYILAHLGLAGFLNWEFDAFTIPTTHKKLPVLTPPFIAATRAKNMGLYIWTINNKKAMKRLIKLGVDGIMTDYPDKMKDISC